MRKTVVFLQSVDKKQSERTALSQCNVGHNTLYGIRFHQPLSCCTDAL